MISRYRNIYYLLIIIFIVYSFAVFFSIEDVDNNSLSVSGRKGKLLFQQYNCISCHQIYGLGGYMGPDLTNIISTKGKGRAYAGVFIKNGTARMPNFNLNQEEVDALLDYLTDVDISGTTISKEFELNWFGTIK